MNVNTTITENDYFSFNYVCTDCEKNFEITPHLMVCPNCSTKKNPKEPLRGVLEVALKKKNNLDRFGQLVGLPVDPREFLPVEKNFFPPIPVGKTRMWEVPGLRKRYNHPHLFITDDSSNPSASFKDRASFLVAALAKKFDISNIVVASTGNAASSMAAIGAAAGIQITIFLPQSAPPAKIVQSLQYGATVIPVDGNYDLAYDLSLEYTKEYNKEHNNEFIQNRGGRALSRNTGFNPLTIEGKKSVSLEIFNDLGHHVPDYVFVPTGDGVILAGVYKGFRDLYTLGLTDKIPVIYAVQAEGSNAIHRAFIRKHEPLTEQLSEPLFDYQPSSTIADSISVDIPRNGYHAIKNLRQFGGRTVVVSDSEILRAQHQLSANAGLFVEPAAAAAFAGFLAATSCKELESDARIVILVTGHGLKDTVSALKGVNPPRKAIKNIRELF
ncbi:MAG: pyridoxal-phosphate dependent enzyme [Oligoflexia bacterium]|nr:pyridoxal-phosphate dependent enzyme [Oligoflexia bacterium]